MVLFLVRVVGLAPWAPPPKLRPWPCGEFFFFFFFTFLRAIFFPPPQFFLYPKTHLVWVFLPIWGDSPLDTVAYGGCVGGLEPPPFGFFLGDLFFPPTGGLPTTFPPFFFPFVFPFFPPPTPPPGLRFVGWVWWGTPVGFFPTPRVCFPLWSFWFFFFFWRPGGGVSQQNTLGGGPPPPPFFLLNPQNKKNNTPHTV